MEAQKNIGKWVALSVGLALILGAGIYGVVKLINRDKDDSIVDPLATGFPDTQNLNSTLPTDKNKGFTTDQIKQMQSYLLEIGKYYNNQVIIDSIQLTGGIDGNLGEGFETAIIEARDKGYLVGYEDVLLRLGY